MKSQNRKRLMKLAKDRQRLSNEYRVQLREALDAVVGDVEIPELSDTFWQEIGRRVRCTRKELGITQALVGAVTGLGVASITNIEKGRQHPRLLTLVRMAELFSCDYRDFLPDAQLKAERTARKKRKAKRADR